MMIVEISESTDPRSGEDLIPPKDQIGGFSPPLTADEHVLGTNLARAQACSFQNAERSNWFLEYIKAGTPTADRIFDLPNIMKEAAEVPMRVWTPDLAHFSNGMGLSEKAQLAIVLMGQALNFRVDWSGGSLALDKSYKDTDRRHKQLVDEYAIYITSVSNHKDDIENQNSLVLEAQHTIRKVGKLTKKAYQHAEDCWSQIYGSKSLEGGE